MGSPSLGAAFHGRVFKDVEDLGFTHQTLTLTQGEVIGEVSQQGYSLALRVISWYSARVLLLSPSAKVFGTCDGWRDSLDERFSPYWHMDVA